MYRISQRKAHVFTKVLRMEKAMAAGAVSGTIRLTPKIKRGYRNILIFLSGQEELKQNNKKGRQTSEAGGREGCPLEKRLASGNNTQRYNRKGDHAAWVRQRTISRS